MRYLLIGFLVLALCFAACGGDDEPGGPLTTTSEATTTTVTQSTTTSEATTTTVAQTTTTSESTTTMPPVRWQAVELDSATFGAGTGIGMVAFHPVDNSWVAIGSTIPAEVRDEEPPWYCFERGLCPVSVWRSPDGVAWTRALELEAGAFVADLTDVRGAPGPLYPTMLAVGAEYDEGVLPLRPVPAVWHLDIDGAPGMTRVVDDDLDGVAGQINGIAGIPLGYAAVGWTCPDDTSECLVFEEGRQPTIWVSDDGHDWQVVSDGAATQGELNDVVGLWFPEPAWVAVGGDWNRPVAARGSPGGDWTFVELPSNANPSIEYQLEDGPATVTGPCSGTVRAVTTGSDGSLVAVGPCVPLDSFEPYVTSWVSSDGLTWNQTTVPGGLELPAWMRTVTWTGNEYVAGGWLLGSGSDTPVVWTSSEGTTWTRLAISEDPGGIQDIAVGASTQIAVGGGHIWIR